jgi:hypothetical protein
MFRHIAHTATSLTLAVIGSVLTLTGVSSARAQAYPTYVAAIPFAFGMNDVVFPAGRYQITLLSQHALRLSVVGGTSKASLMVFPSDDASKATTGQLRFMRYGDLYFLRQFTAPHEGSGWQAVSRCLPSANEKRAAKEWMEQAGVHAPRGVAVAINTADQH